jgi:hypothetical protein
VPTTHCWVALSQQPVGQLVESQAQPLPVQCWPLGHGALWPPADPEHAQPLLPHMFEVIGSHEMHMVLLVDLHADGFMLLPMRQVSPSQQPEHALLSQMHWF